MDNSDKVIGYIEFLGEGGMIGEIVPYTSAEKFKNDILDSLDCGRPMTPVVFPDELDAPLRFDADTYFPWGFRSEKREPLHYEIYQARNGNPIFMNYANAKCNMQLADYQSVFKGQIEQWNTLDDIYSIHNRDDRPNASTMHSVSVGDIIVINKEKEAHAFFVQPIGYKQVDDLLPALEKTKQIRKEPYER